MSGLFEDIQLIFCDIWKRIQEQSNQLQMPLTSHLSLQGPHGKYVRVQRTKPGKSALFSWHSLAPTTMNKFKFLTHTWENISPWAGQQLWPPLPENLNESQNFIPQFWEGHTCRKKWSSASGGKYFSYETNARKGSWEKSRRGKLSQGQTQKNWEKVYKNKIC